MVTEYRGLYDNGLVLKATEVMFPSGLRENDIFLSSAMTQNIENIISYHRQTTSNPSFADFLEEIQDIVDEAKGKTVAEIRQLYFPCFNIDNCATH